jgi:hypothetical protein
MPLEIYTSFNKFKNRVLSLYPNEKEAIITDSIINRKILKQFQTQEKDKSDLLKVVNVMNRICQKKLNIDFLFSSFFGKHYAILVEKKSIKAFLSYSKESKTNFQQSIDFNAFKQMVQQENQKLPEFFMEKKYCLLSISILCACQKGKGREIMNLIEKQNNKNCVFMVSNPVKELKNYYESLGFHYDLLNEWAGYIWKFEKNPTFFEKLKKIILNKNK